MMGMRLGMKFGVGFESCTLKSGLRFLEGVYKGPCAQEADCSLDAGKSETLRTPQKSDFRAFWRLCSLFLSESECSEGPKRRSLTGFCEVVALFEPKEGILGEKIRGYRIHTEKVSVQRGSFRGFERIPLRIGSGKERFFGTMRMSFRDRFAAPVLQRAKNRSPHRESECSRRRYPYNRGGILVGV